MALGGNAGSCSNSAMSAIDLHLLNTWRWRVGFRIENRESSKRNEGRVGLMCKSCNAERKAREGSLMPIENRVSDKSRKRANREVRSQTGMRILRRTLTFALSVALSFAVAVPAAKADSILG